MIARPVFSEKGGKTQNRTDKCKDPSLRVRLRPLSDCLSARWAPSQSPRAARAGDRAVARARGTESTVSLRGGGGGGRPVLLAALIQPGARWGEDSGSGGRGGPRELWAGLS